MPLFIPVMVQVSYTIKNNRKKLEVISWKESRPRLKDLFGVMFLFQTIIDIYLLKWVNGNREPVFADYGSYLAEGVHEFKEWENLKLGGARK